MTSPTLRLFNTLLVTMLAILVGLVCVRLQLLRPGEGDLKGMGFFVGSIAFPLLIFSTVATADMGQMDFGVIGACSLGKIAVMVLTWVLAFVAFQPKRSRGQRILTASVFAFFAVASNDFALGFPVIDALYGEKQNMSVYIAGNSLVGSFVFVPLTMIAFAIGGALKSSTGDAEAASCLNIFKTVMYDLATNPVIVMTCAGLLFKGVLGQTLSHEGGKLKLPMPLSNLVDLFTAPFGMCALFLTGTSLRSPKIAVWAVGLVLMKVVVCAYLSYAFGTLLLGPATTEKEKILRDFTFFYGAIPTSSAPIVFANQFDPEASELIATAVLFGLILAGPIMFITAFSLNDSGNLEQSMTILQQVQASADLGSLFCGLIFLGCLVLLRHYWCFKCPGKQLVALYGLVLMCYAGVSLAINPWVSSLACQDYIYNSRTPVIVAFGWLQNCASLLLLVLQFILVCNGPISHERPMMGLMMGSACLILALLPAIFATPNTVNEICGKEPESLPLCLNVGWSCVKLAVALVLAICGLRRTRSEEEPESSENSEMESEASSIPESPADRWTEWNRLVPTGIILTVTIMNIVKIMTQVINAAQVHFSMNKNQGSFAAMLLLESVLEHGQGMVLAAALFFDSNFTSLLLRIVPRLCPFCTPRRPKAKGESWYRGWAPVCTPDVE